MKKEWDTGISLVRPLGLSSVLSSLPIGKGCYQPMVCSGIAINQTITMVDCNAMPTTPCVLGAQELAAILDLMEVMAIKIVM